MTSIGLFVLKMPFALMLGGLAGLLNIIPYIGPILAAVPAVLLSLLPDTPNIFLVVGLYILVEIVDSFVFTPIFLGKAVDLSPLTVVVSVLIGGQLLGTLGIILAIPAAAICKVLLFHYFGPKPRNKAAGISPPRSRAALRRILRHKGNLGFSPEAGSSRKVGKHSRQRKPASSRKTRILSGE